MEVGWNDDGILGRAEKQCVEYCWLVTPCKVQLVAVELLLLRLSLIFIAVEHNETP